MNNTNKELSPRSLAAKNARQSQDHNHDHTSCPANIEFTPEELEILDNNTRALFTQIPFDGPGYECYGYDGDGWHHYGRSSTIQAIQYICEKWAKNHPDAPRIGVGDISMANGGNTPRHASHEEGIDADFSVVTNNGKEEPSNWQAGNYSQKLTQAFVDLVENNPVLAPRVILFNDPQIKGVQWHSGHDDHLHVRFQLGPNVAAAPSYTSEAQSETLHLMSPYIKGETVKKLQNDLATAGIQVDADGIFGKGTEAAVKQFQEQQGLAVDGIAGKATLAKLSEVIAA